jgi:hypothetical protein
VPIIEQVSIERILSFFHLPFPDGLPNGSICSLSASFSMALVSASAFILPHSLHSCRTLAALFLLSVLFIAFRI